MKNISRYSNLPTDTHIPFCGKKNFYGIRFLSYTQNDSNNYNADNRFS